MAWRGVLLFNYRRNLDYITLSIPPKITARWLIFNTRRLSRSKTVFSSTLRSSKPKRLPLASASTRKSALVSRYPKYTQFINFAQTFVALHCANEREDSLPSTYSIILRWVSLCFFLVFGIIVGNDSSLKLFRCTFLSVVPNNRFYQ